MSEYIIDMSNSSYQSTSGLLCADASQLREEIVRCRDCRLQDDIKYCERLGFEVGDYGYCAWPVRKD